MVAETVAPFCGALISSVVADEDDDAEEPGLGGGGGGVGAGPPAELDDEDEFDEEINDDVLELDEKAEELELDERAEELELEELENPSQLPPFTVSVATFESFSVSPWESLWRTRTRMRKQWCSMVTGLMVNVSSNVLPLP